MQLVDLGQYRKRDVVSKTRKLAALAESGEMTGIVFACKFGEHDHRAGVAGDYARHPEQALEAILMLEQELVPTGTLLFRESA